jgi:Zn-dependent protease
VSGLGLNLDPATIITIAIFLLVAFPIHEFFHALVAYRLGDSTAKYAGRLSLNPIVHFDPVGGGLLTITMLLGGFVFGWAKPTPINPYNMRYGHRGEALVALAGPASNAVMAVAGAIPLRFIIATGMVVPDLVVQVLYLFVYVNVILAIFNLVPIPPLDGSKLLFGALDPRTVYRIRPVLEQYGFLILIVAIIPIFGGRSLLGIVVVPIIDAVVRLLVGV